MIYSNLTRQVFYKQIPSQVKEAFSKSNIIGRQTSKISTQQRLERVIIPISSLDKVADHWQLRFLVQATRQW